MLLKRKTINTLEGATFIEVLKNFTEWYEDRSENVSGNFNSAFTNILIQNKYDYEEVLVRAIQINQGYCEKELEAEIEVTF